MKKVQIITPALALILGVFLSCNALAYDETLEGGSVKVIAGVETVLRVSMEDYVGIKIDPGSKDPYVVPINLGVYTNSPAGYQSFITTASDRATASDNLATALRHSSVNQAIDSLNDTTTFGNFPAGYWGFSIDGGKTFDGVPARNEQPVQVSTDAGLSFGVKVPEQQASGNYANTIVVSVVTRHIQTPEDLFSGITYMQEMTQSVCDTENAGLSKQLIDRRDGKTYWVTKMKDGNCWMTQNLDFELSRNGTTLTHADTDVFTTKTITVDSENTPTSILYLDGGDYYVPGGDYYYTDDGEGRFFPTSELTSTSLDWHFQVGSFYSWPAATAGSGTANVKSVEADESICPQGWRLPTYTFPMFINNTYNFSRLYDIQPETTHQSDNSPPFNYSMPSFSTAPFYYVDLRFLFKEGAETSPVTLSHGYLGYNTLRSYFHDTTSYADSSGLALWSSTANPPYRDQYSNAEAVAIGVGSYGNSTPLRITGPYTSQAAMRNAGASIRCVSKKNDLFSISTMQEVTPEIVENTDTEMTKRLTDTRDGKKYWVTKMYDGNLWMSQNLDFAISTSGTTLSPATSNVLTEKTITASSNFGSDPTGIYYYDDGNRFYDSGSKSDFNNNVQSTQGHLEVGSYYSWYAATAGSAANTNNTGDDATESICPKGWRLPTNNGGNGLKDNSYDKMITTFLENASRGFDTYYGILGARTMDEMYYLSKSAYFENPPLYLYPSGVIDETGSIEQEYQIGAYWSSALKSKGSSNSGIIAYQLKVANTSRGSYSPSDSNAEQSSFGAKVRCVAVGGEPFTIRFDANGGIGGPTVQNGMSQNREFSTTLSTLEPIQSGLSFMGWSTDPVATTATYQPGDSISFSESQLNLYAVWSPATIIRFDANGGTGSMQDQNIPSRASKNLRANQFTRHLYGFMGWSTNPDAVIAEYANKGVFNSEYVESDTTVTLYAVWSPTIQSFSCDSLENIGDKISLPDARDNQMYEIEKKADGNCWTIDNLKLDLTKLVEDISPENTNNPTLAFMTAAATHPASSDSWCSNQTDPSCTNQIKYNSVNLGNTSTVANSPDGNVPIERYGVYYNYYTATAGHATNATINGLGMEGDLCPYGWHLPTGTINGEMATLYNNPNSTMDLFRAGYFSSTSISARGYSPFYWVANNVGSNGLGAYYYGSSDTSFNSSWPQSFGATVRCVANKEQEFTLSYDTQGGSAAPAAQVGTSNKGKRKFTINPTAPTRSEYFFDGWSTNQNTQSAEYQPGQEIVVTKPQTTLYAIWVKSMQDFDCSVLANVGDSTTRIDIRDGKEYSIAKLADGHCWMTEDLDLTLSAFKRDMTTENTNNPTAGFMQEVNYSPISQYYGFCTTADYSCINRIQYYKNSTWNESTQSVDYITYYNWYTATAGRDISFQNGNTDGDICPYGWHLPTGGNTGEFAQLINALGGYSINGVAQYMDLNTNPTSRTMKDVFVALPNNFSLGGYKYGSDVYSVGSVGTYWTSTSFTGVYAYRFDFGDNYLYPGTSYNDKFHGHTIRCMANY